MTAVPGMAVERLARKRPVLKGISLAAYSMLRHMRFTRKGEGKGTMEMSGFLDYCASIGVDGAELTSYFFQLPVELSTLNGLKRKAHLLGLDLTSGAIGNNFSHAPGTPEADKQLRYTRDWLDHYSDLGVPLIRVFAGRPSKGVTPEQAIKHIVENVHTLLDHAAKRGVMLAIENHDFASNVDYLLQIAEQIDSPWCGLMLDSGNLAPTADPYAQLARIAPYALMAQVKVEIPVNGKKEPTNFKRLADVLRGAGYGGYLVLEYEAAEEPKDRIPHYVNELRKVLG